MHGQFFASVRECLRSSLLEGKTQLTPFELMGPGAAAATFKDRIRGRRVVFFVDNDTALAILKKGRSRKQDSNRVVFNIHAVLYSLGVTAFFRRVPSDHNCSDPVSRGLRAPFGGDVGELLWLDFFR